MSRSGGNYTAPSSSWNPAIEGTTVDETDWNALLDDIEAALTESVYTGGLGSTDNQLVRTDGTDAKKVQGTGITVDDSDNVTGIAALTATTVNIGNADTTLARSGAGDVTIEGNAVYRAGGTDVPIADGGTGASTATAAFNALSPLTTKGDILYHDGTGNVRLGAGTAGQVLTSGGAGGNPSWSSAAGTGDMVAANNLSDVASVQTARTNLGLGSSDSPQFAGINLGASSDTTITRSAAGDIAVEGNAVYRAGGTDVPIADGGTGSSTAAAGFRALAEGIGSTQGDILYRGATQWTVLGAGTSGQVLQSGGVGGNPAWATVSGTGDLVSTNNLSDVSNVSAARLNLGVSPSAPQGRLTLLTLTPVMTSTQSARTTIYYTPHVGRHVPLYDGTRWKMHDIGGELEQLTTDSTKSPASVTADKNYDLFVWNDSGTYRCTRGPAWSSDTARGTGAGTTELQMVAGFLTNANAITNGPAANRGTYVGTVRSNGSSQIDFIFGSGDTAGVVGVWNMYNRTRTTMRVFSTTATWTQNNGAYRQANSQTSYKVSFVCGVADEFVFGEYTTMVNPSSSINYNSVGVGYDSITAITGLDSLAAASASGQYFQMKGNCAEQPLGYHYIAALERAGTSTTATWYGTTRGVLQVDINA